MVFTRKNIRRTPGGISRLAWLLPMVLALACSLKVDDLPQNNPPEVGEIVMTPDQSNLAPTDSFTVRVEASDPEGDKMFFNWSSGSVGSWVSDATIDSVAIWIAPADFTGIDSIHLSLLVHDGDLANSVTRRKDFEVVNKTGPIRILVVDTGGDPAEVEMAVVGHDTTTFATSDHLFSEIPWGDQSVITFDSDGFYGAYQAAENFAGYPRMVFNHYDREDTLTIIVAPKSVLVVPGRPAETLIEDVQTGIDYCNTNGIDTLLLMPGDYLLPGHYIDPEDQAGSLRTALMFTEADLTFMAFPDPLLIQPTVLDAGGADLGLYFEGRGPGMRVEGIHVHGSTSSGACLSHSSARFDSVTFDECGAAGIFLSSLGGDTLRLENCVVRDNEYGVSLSGGHLETDGVLVQGSIWYGLWLRDGATGNLHRSTFVLNRVEGVILRDTGLVDINRCLFSLNGFGIFVDTDANAQLDCNLFWNNDFGNYRGVTPGPEDILDDPFFVEPDAFDWHLQPGSPALEAACGDGQIGAFGQGELRSSPPERRSP